ncbi:EF-hand calcium-binding domain-containing protein 6 [Dromiciops gliroides]|uniref:EF-hand calcium-binding domain-containing protein 6 n=1 Tax=Dromiciops gliroides TaxID=33562 RepID=UPI001CC8137F|nr:EF-hand calcium-binding domain-containing protein 6 [Dromiciops gliroides]
MKGGERKARELIRTVVNSVDLGSLHPMPSGMKADARPHSSPLGITTPNSGRSLIKSSSSTCVVNPVLSFADLDRIFFQKILKKEEDLKKAFSIIDSEQTLRVTKNQLRRIIEVYLLPLTRKQFNEVLSQIPLTSNGEVPYLEFLARFGRLITNVHSLKRVPGKQCNVRSLNQLECQLGEKIFKNIKGVTKAFKLFDCTQSGQIHPNGLRQVLENYCFKMRDDEFEKLWNRYSIGKDAALDYNAFLKNLAMNINLNQKYSMNSKAQGPLPLPTQPIPLDTVPWAPVSVGPDVLECTWRVKPENKYVFSFSSTSGDGWENSSMDEIEAAFCREFGVSTLNIEKALSAFDTTKRGYVSLNYLKIVVDNFIFPLPKGIFLQLLKRLGFKTTGKIAWKQFLRKCQDCALVDNGAMIPMRKKKRMCGAEPIFKENIIVKLCRHVDDGFSALKKAFHTVNPKQDGKITGKELRHILNCILWKISDGEYKELMQILDPAGSGYVNYITFLYLLEEENSVIRKKRLSGLRDERIPQFLAWDSVEEVLQDAISKNSQDFHTLLKTYDIGDTGLISRNNLKKILQTFCRYLSDEHLTKLCDKFQDVISGGILYKKLLSSIGVPSPTHDSPVTVQSFQSLNGICRREDIFERSKHSDYKNDPTKNKTLEEVIESLKNWIQLQDIGFRDTFLEYSKHPLEKISKEEFRKVLEDNGMPMDDEQFGLLVKKIGYKNEGLSYLDFASGFEASDGKPSGQEPPVVQTVPTSVTPKTSFESHFTTADDCLKNFSKRIKETYGDAYSAFYKTDTNHDGIINMTDFRTMLHHMLITLKEEEFMRLLESMNLKPGLTLNYREFRNLCEKRQFKKDDPPQRLIRPKPKNTDSDLACEQAHNYLVSEARNRWFDLSKNFLETDNEGNGILRRRDIRNSLYGFDIPITPREFEKLWARYDTTQKGYITYQEFLSRLGIEYSPSIHRPYAVDHFNFMGHFTKPEQILEETKELQHYLESRPFKDKFKDHYQDISLAFAKLDKQKNAFISLNELQKVLQEYHPNITEEEITTMLKSWGISYNDNIIYYHEFLKALDNLKRVKAHPKEKEECQPIVFSVLTPDQVLKKMKEMVSANYNTFFKAFAAYDKEDTGIIKASDFAQVIKDLCLKLKDSQYTYVLKKLRLHLNTHINWKFFLRNFPCFFEETAAEWSDKMQRACRPKSPKDQFLKDILTRIRDVVTARYLIIAQEFSDLDCSKSNLISREDFKGIFNRHIQILNDEQFESLWNELPLNSEGRLKYQDFLSKFNMEKALSPPATGDSVKTQRSGGNTPEAEAAAAAAPAATAPAPAPGSAPATGGGSAPGSAPRPQTGDEIVPGTAASAASRAWVPPLQNCEVIENKLRKKIQGCWKEMLKECKEKDVDKQGEITVAEFQALVDKYNLEISKDECQHLITKYDLKNCGKFAYCDFFQSCVLLLKAKETSLMQRMKIQQVYMMKGSGTQSASFYAALLRIQPKILHCWRPMRRTFKSYDESGTGLLSIADFRKVLRQYGINLSEEEFFHILEYYDKTLSSKISYNDFLRAFLQ